MGRGLEIGAVENLEGVHAVASTTDFLRLLSYISGLVRSASLYLHPRHDHNSAEVTHPPISEELTRAHHAGGLVTIVRVFVQWLGKASRTVTRRLQAYY